MSKVIHQSTRLTTVFLLGLLVAGLSTTLLAQRQLLDRVVAVVDEDVILQSELERRLAEIIGSAQRSGRELPPMDELRDEVLESLVIENLQLQLADRVSIRFDDDTINRIMGNMASNNNMTFDEYVSTLEAQGVYLQTREDIRKQMAIQELQRGMVNRRISITNQEIENFLNSETGREAVAADYFIEHMVVLRGEEDPQDLDTSKRNYAADLVARIEEGETLPQVRNAATSAGVFPINATNFGWRKLVDLPALFSDIVSDMELGEVAGPIEAGNGYHIIQLSDRRGGTEQLVDQTNVRHILLAPNEIRNEEQTKAAIEDLREQIINGADFATLARQNSDDANSVVAGGDLDWVNENSLPPLMENIIDNLEIGELSEPFRTDAGWHIAEVLDRRVYDISSQYTRVQAENALRNRKFDLELQNWLIEIREEAFVEFID